MKLLRNVLIVLIIAVGIMYFMGPAENSLSRTVNIDAPASSVFPYLKSLKQMDRWSPWSKRDPNLVNTYKGTDGEVGSVNSWVGNDEVGSGSQEVTKIIDNELVETKLTFIAPFKSVANAYFKSVAGENGGTDVTWGFHGKNGFVERIMFLFVDFDAMLGADYEEGLTLLKELVEKEAKVSDTKYPIKEIDFLGKTFIGVRDVVKIEAVQPFFAENLPKAAAAAGDKMVGMPYGLFFTFDMEKGETDMAGAVAVSSEVGSLEKFEAEAGKALQLDYDGDYDEAAAAHFAIEDYMKARSLEFKGFVMEEYITDPMSEPDTNKWLTQITYLVQ